jgi:ribosome-associated protein
MVRGANRPIMVRMRDVEIGDGMIRLGQFLKLAALAESGSDAKRLIEEGVVRVNGQPETRRGRQLHHGDVVAIGADSTRVTAAGA